MLGGGASILCSVLGSYQEQFVATLHIKEHLATLLSQLHFFLSDVPSMSVRVRGFLIPDFLNKSPHCTNSLKAHLEEILDWTWSALALELFPLSYTSFTMPILASNVFSPNSKTKIIIAWHSRFWYWFRMSHTFEFLKLLVVQELFWIVFPLFDCLFCRFVSICFTSVHPGQNRAAWIVYEVSNWNRVVWLRWIEEWKLITLRSKGENCWNLVII